MSKEVSLETPLLVNIAAGTLGVAAAFMCMMSVQFALSLHGATGKPLYFTIAYAVVGLLGMVMAGATAKGHTWGAVGGIVASLGILSLCWTPILFAVLAFTSLASGGLAGMAVLLLGISVPLCVRLGKARRDFFQDIEQT